MKQAAFSDPNCTPNTITYSSLISACAAGSRLDKALQVYDEMQEAGLQPDHITYSTLISAYEKAGELAEALALLDKVHEAGGAASADTYVKVMQYLAGKQLWNRALEVFLELQAAGDLSSITLKKVPSQAELAHVMCDRLFGTMQVLHLDSRCAWLCCQCLKLVASHSKHKTF